jgi:hypothetical protein
MDGGAGFSEANDGCPSLGCRWQKNYELFPETGVAHPS